MSAAPTYFGTIKTGVLRILNSDGTNYLTLVTPGPNGCRIDAISLINGDTIAYNVQVVVTKGGSDYLLGTVALPASAGLTPGTSVDLLSVANFPWLRSDGAARFMYLENGAVLRARVSVAVTATKEVHLIAQYADA